jgi:DNA transposition AAA+ family ATPase
MEKKQTAVEWLENELAFFLKDIIENKNHLLMINLFEQAKAMEKEQMVKFALHLHNVDMSKTGTDILIDEAEQYYNETYNKQ